MDDSMCHSIGWWWMQKRLGFLLVYFRCQRLGASWKPRKRWWTKNIRYCISLMIMKSSWTTTVPMSRKTLPMSSRIIVASQTHDDFRVVFTWDQLVFVRFVTSQNKTNIIMCVCVFLPWVYYLSSFAIYTLLFHNVII